MGSHRTPASEHRSRRQFLKSGSAVAVGAAVTSNLAIPKAVHAGGSETLRIGLIGCGGRGNGAAKDALEADPNTKLVALAEIFPDRLEDAKRNLRASCGSQFDVADEHCYVGFDAYRHVIDQVDLVLLATPPHFRPEHLRYAVVKGVHAFVEKPVATDMPGVRDVLATCEEAKKKNLSIVSGLCWRYFEPRRQAIQRVLSGEIGDVVAVQTTYNSQGVWEPRKTPSNVDSGMEYQMRNWYYYTWLSGDHIVEQAIHALDTMGWVTEDAPPERCWGTGGRQVRTEAKYGNIYDHFSLVYEYANGMRGYHTCRHWRGSPAYVKDFVLGTAGTCDVFGLRTNGQEPWRYRGPKPNMYRAEHEELMASIRSGNPINNGPYMCHSTSLAIMGRLAAYTGKSVTWEQCQTSQEKLGPQKYEWGDMPRPEVAVPGVTELV